MECHPHPHTVNFVVDHNSIHLRGEKMNMYMSTSYHTCNDKHYINAGTVVETMQLHKLTQPHSMVGNGVYQATYIHREHA